MTGERSDPGDSPDRQAGSGSGAETSVWESVVAGCSALLVLGCIGFMLYEGLSKTRTTPQIEVVADSVIDAGDGYLVLFHAQNRGQATAARLVVEGVLTSDARIVEASQATLDFVPPEARRGGGLIFSHDPRRYMLEIRAKGFELP